jgi:hypothetical protein
VYEGKDDESERLEAMNNSNYDADISNCSLDNHMHHSDEHDEHDVGIGHEDESNLDQCMYADEPRARDSGNLEDIDKEQIEAKFLNLPEHRAPSPHSMDSWINYSNSSDEYSTSQELIVRKGTKLNLHDDDTTQDNEDVDVYDKINFVNAKSITSAFKKSKIDGSSHHPHRNHPTPPPKFPSFDDTAKIHHLDKSAAVPSAKTTTTTTTITTPQAGDQQRFKQLPEDAKLSPTSAANCEASKTHDTDDGIEVEEEEEEEDDDQLSSLSSNIDTIIVSESGETKFYNASGEQEEHPSVKKKKSCDSTDNKGKSDAKATTTTFSHTNGHPSNGSNNKSAIIISPLVDVRIIDFAHTTFTSKEPSPFLDEHEIKKIHHGPDGGFLTGISSLKRILSEIIVEAI